MGTKIILTVLSGFKIEEIVTRSNGYENDWKRRVQMGTKISTRYAFNMLRW
jgi:hypothetical protein